MEFMDIVYIVLWGVLAFYCLFSAHKMHPILYFMGAFFVFLFAWYLINSLIEVDLFDGVYNIIFRCVAAAFLIVLVVFYIVIKKRSKSE